MYVTKILAYTLAITYYYNFSPRFTVESAKARDYLEHTSDFLHRSRNEKLREHISLFIFSLIHQVQISENFNYKFSDVSKRVSKVIWALSRLLETIVDGTVRIELTTRKIINLAAAADSCRRRFWWSSRLTSCRYASMRSRCKIFDARFDHYFFTIRAYMYAIVFRLVYGNKIKVRRTVAFAF